MAASSSPDITDVSSLYGTTIGFALTTTVTTDLITVSTNKILKINTMMVSNIDGTNSADVTLALVEEGLNQEDYIEICKRLNRAPNRTELGMFGVMWSEHCCYRNSKILLNFSCLLKLSLKALKIFHSSFASPKGR